MTNFNVSFSNPLFMLLLIPTLVLALYTFFKVNRKFRYTRNRVISLILCTISILCCTLLISDTTFSYDKINDENEVILLVDSSFSNNESEKAKNSFVKSVIENTDDKTSLGIVTFGHNQVLAVPMTKQLSGIYDQYINSNDVIDQTTNIAAALNYAHSLFKNPQLAKIVLITDGIETDGDAIKATKSISLTGTKIDVVKFDNKHTKNEVQPLKVILPEKTILSGKQTQLSIQVESSLKTDALITMYDNDKEISSQFVTVKKGVNDVFFKHTFEGTGFHELRFKIKSSEDESEQNNIIYSYVNIRLVDKVLILERFNEGKEIVKMLSDSQKVTIKNIKDAPTSLDLLRDYDEVILANIANSDMPKGFDKILNEYVSEIGGSLLTVGGSRKENGKNIANVYNREDMKDTLYQDMLPVLAEDYRPPIAVMLVIDISGSMSIKPDGWDKTKMDVAKESAKAGLSALDSRDYVGIVTFGDTATTIIAPTPVTKRKEIETAIDRIDFAMEGTIYSNGLESAGLLLKSVRGVNKKHTILISDGSPSAGDIMYLQKTESNYNAGITTSTIAFTENIFNLENIAKIGHGRNYSAMHGSDLSNAIEQDLSAPEIKDYEYKVFKPEIGENSEIFEGVKNENIPNLNGFFGTKLKKGAKALMVGEYGEPIYATWEYGKGKVGSLMFDLNGEFSSEFINNDNGIKIVNNIVSNLLPMAPVKKDKIEIDSKISNSEVKTNIYSQINDGEKIKVIISKVNTNNNSKAAVQTIDIDDFNGNCTIDYHLLESGVYEIEVQKLNAAGEVIESNVDYQEFSYSQEYNPFLNDIDNSEFLNKITNTANGHIIETPQQVFDDLLKVFHKEYDPRYIFASLIIISLLLDIAIRKFKFKWIHELIRDNNKKRDKETQNEKN